MSSADDGARLLARGEASREQAREVVREVLLTADPEDVGEEMLEPRQATGGYLEALRSVGAGSAELEARVRSEEAAAEELVDSLLSLPAGERLAAAQKLPAAGSWALVERLGERSFAAGPENPERSRSLAEVAVELAERIAEGPESTALRSDLRAAAWSLLGNAERVASYLPAAEAAHGRAKEYLESGTGDPILRARWLGFVATLRSDQSRFDEAIELAGRAAGLFRRAGDDHGYGRTLIKLATFHAYRREIEPALERLDEAAAHVDAELEPRLLFLVHLNRASYCERAGRFPEAEAELIAAGKVAEAPLDRLRVRWLAARVSLGRGELAAGERALSEVRSAFEQAAMGYEVAQVSLELAALYAEQGRVADQKRLAAEMVPLFAARGVHPEARAALALYCDAARDEAVSLTLARRLAEYFERAAGRPGLAFQRDDA